jgi:hypothetical protein
LINFFGGYNHFYFNLPAKYSIMRSAKKTVSVFLCLAAGVVISVAATKPTASNPAKSTTKNDTGFFKNLQVLPKDISKDSLDEIMDGFKAALGVKCGFCHAFDTTTKRLNFASDAKDEKNVARYMLKMTAGINATYFNFEKSTRPDTINVVRCITCHHGSPHPNEPNNGEEEHHDMQQPHDSTAPHQ